MIVNSSLNKLFHTLFWNWSNEEINWITSKNNIANINKIQQMLKGEIKGFNLLFSIIDCKIHILKSWNRYRMYTDLPEELKNCKTKQTCNNFNIVEWNHYIC